MRQNHIYTYTKRIWMLNLALVALLVAIYAGGELYMASVVTINESKAKPFDGSIEPMAFIPNWRVGSYIDNRAHLHANDVAKNDFIPLPDPDDIQSDFNAYFTYMNMWMGSYMDEDRVVGAGSHAGVDIRAPLDTPVFSVANGIVYKVKDFEDEKYVVIKHKDVDYQGVIDDYYSGYLHLGTVLVEPGDLVNKGSMIGTVGMTGITTTPHLHFQMDTDSAPFHPYWPFTLSEAYEKGYDFYTAVNKGLNQKNLRQYTVDPLDWLKNAKPASGNATSANDIATSTKTSAAVEDGAKEIIEVDQNTQNIIQLVKNDENADRIKVVDEDAYKSDDEEDAEPKSTRDYANMNLHSNDDEFPDLSKDHKYYNAIKYFVDKEVLHGYEDGNFGPDNTLTRSELLAVVLRALDLEYEGEVLVGIFRDVPEDHWVNPLITNAIERGIITTKRPIFEPNRPVTRSEFLAILAFASQKDLDKYKETSKRWNDVDRNHWSSEYAAMAYNMKLFDYIDGDYFGTNSPVKRGEVANAMYKFMSKTGYFR